MEKRNKVIWTCGPNGGAMVKCLTIKQLKSALTASLSGKWIQYAAWMILIIRNNHSHLQYLWWMVRSSYHWSNHQRGRGKINQIPKDLHLPIYLPVQPLCPTSCPEVCLWWDDLSIFFMEKEKHVDLWEEAWAFRRFYTSFYYSGDLLGELTGRGRGFKRPRLTLYISPPTWSGQEPRHREGWALLWLIDVPNKE